MRWCLLKQCEEEGWGPRSLSAMPRASPLPVFIVTSALGASVSLSTFKSVVSSMRDVTLLVLGTE